LPLNVLQLWQPAARHHRRWWHPSLIGVFDVYSATLVGRRSDGIFVSDLGFGASHHGLPDTGMGVLREQMRPIQGEGRLDQLIFGILRHEWLERRGEAGG
jgi:hypothetical protein